MARPNPVPSLVRVFELSTWRNFSKIRSHSSRGIPGPKLLALLNYLIEQPRVLDCDNRLIREGLQKRYLLWREWSNVGASQKDRPDRLSLSYQGSGQGRAVTDHQLRWFSVRKFAFEKCRDIINMHGLAVENCPPSDASTRQR